MGVTNARSILTTNQGIVFAVSSRTTEALDALTLRCLMGRFAIQLFTRVADNLILAIVYLSST